jgi:steroid 5-alpha reductase family enzyme
VVCATFSLNLHPVHDYNHTHSDLMTIDFRMHWTATKVRTHLLVLLAYLLTFAAGWGATLLVPHWMPIWQLALADVVGTVVIFAFSVAVRNTSMYDPYWSVIPIFFLPFWLMQPEAANAELARQVLMCGVVIFWGVRLTFNWMRYFDSLHHEDWRYLHYKGLIKNPILYWGFSFMGLHMVPTVVVFLACMSLWPGLTTANAPIGLLDILGLVMTVAAVFIELIADEQLRNFSRDPANKGKIMNQGIWAYSRHPNYFGENLFWWGLSMFAVSADASYWWVMAGPLVNTVLFVFASLPLMENRSLQRRPGYAEHQKRTSILIPWPPKKA